MKTDFIKPYPARGSKPGTVAIHIWGSTSFRLRCFRLSLSGHPSGKEDENEKEEEEEEGKFNSLIGPLGLEWRLLASLYKMYRELFALSYCGAIFTAGDGPDRRFHISTLVPAEDAAKAEELVKEMGAYLEEEDYVADLHRLGNGKEFALLHPISQ